MRLASAKIREALGKAGRQHAAQLEVQLPGVGLVSLRPTKGWEPSHSRKTKVGRLSFTGSTIGSDRRLKIFESHSPEHANVIQALSCDSTLSQYLPRVIDLSGSIVVAEWVDGREITGDPTRAVVELLAEFHHPRHSEIVANLAGDGFSFDYWYDFLRPRAQRGFASVGCQALFTEYAPTVDHVWNSGRLIVQHPDVTPSNVVAANTGQHVVIDNELLGIGRWDLLDLCNAAYGAGKWGKALSNMYLSELNRRLESEEIQALRIAWCFRLVGSAYAAGDLRRIHKFASTRGLAVGLPF